MIIDELEAKVLEGIKRANRKLVETEAANNESLIIGDKKKEASNQSPLKSF